MTTPPRSDFDMLISYLANGVVSHRERVNKEVTALAALCSEPDTTTLDIQHQMKQVTVWLDCLDRAEQLIVEANYIMKEARNETLPASAPPAPVIFTKGVLPPLSFQDAKTLLYPHTQRRDYLEQALRELEAQPLTKAIKKASGEYMRKAADDFAIREKEKKWR